LKFFLDNCLSPRYAQSLHALSERDGHEVVHLQDKFPRSSPDRDWLRDLGAEGDWVVVSGDTRIVKIPELKAEWARARLTAFFLGQGWMNIPYWDQAVLLVRWWPKILEQARLVEHGTGFEVPYRSPGRFKPILVRS
jgi:PIN like domain